MVRVTAVMVSLLVVSVYILAEGPTYACHPLATDDAGTVAPGHFELKTSTEAEHSDVTAFSGGQSLTLGLTENVDVGLAVGYAKLKGAEQASGLADPEIRLKWRFAGDGETKRSFAITAGCTTPSHSAVSSGDHDYGLTFVATLPLGGNLWHANIGRTWVGQADADDAVACSIALQMPVGTGRAWYAEVSGDDSGSAGEPARVRFLVGWSMEHRSLGVLSMGVSRGLTSTSPSMGLTFGMTREY